MSTNTDIETKLKEFHKYLMDKISFYEDRTLNAPDPDEAEHYQMLYKAVSNIENEFARTFLERIDVNKSDSSS